MRAYDMSEKAMIFSYSILTAQVALTLEDVIKGNQLNKQQQKILNDGANLLSKVIEGATLVEGKKFKDELIPTMEGLTVYGYALSTFRKLDFLKEKKEFTAILEDYHKEMINIVKENKKGNIDISSLKKFFIALGNSFSHDIQKESYNVEKLPVNNKKQQNDYLYA